MAGAARRRPFDHVVVLVCDSVGCGDAPDAADFGDAGANTLHRVIDQEAPAIDNLVALGLGRIPGLPRLPAPAATSSWRGCWGRMTERSAAKDTMSGHWELMCVPSARPFPLFPEGFPDEVMRRFESEVGRSTLGNRAASGTEILVELGEEHVRTGAPIVYTSGDSVLQIAAHEEVVPVVELYEMCAVARGMMTGPLGVARVIARPFSGTDPDTFARTPRRRDFALPPPSPTALDQLLEAGFRTCGIGKISDIFSGRGVGESIKTIDNDDGVRRTIAALRGDAAELIFTNLVDFDSDFGHRRDVRGYARALARFDAQLPDLLGALGPRDLLMITADHGNDPGFAGTDHTRERVPLLAVSATSPGVDLGTRESFADLGQTVLDNFGLGAAAGTSFLPQIVAS